MAKNRDGKKEINNKTDDKSQRGPYDIHLTSACDVRRLLSSIINDLRKNRIDVQKARAIIYASSVLLHVFELMLIEKDIAGLQQLAKFKFGYQGGK